MAEGSDKPTGTVRVMYREVRIGDRRKFRAESNDADTGGGARDLRFRPYDQLESVFVKLFPEIIERRRQRGGEPVLLPVLKGAFYWRGMDGKVRTLDSYLEPPTDARPNEGRIAKVHEYSCFDEARVPLHKEGDPVLLLLVQNNKGEVWVHFATRSSLENDKRWDQSFAKEVVECIKARRSANTAITGYIDFESKERFCNGR